MNHRLSVLLLAVLASPSIGEAQIRRPSTSTQPIIAMFCENATTYKLYVRGYLTVGRSGTRYAAAGLGLRTTQTAIGRLTKVEVIDAMSARPLTQYVYALHSGVRARLTTLSSGVNWVGYLARVTAAVRPNTCVYYCFTVTTNGTQTRAQVRSALSGSRVGSYESTSTGANIRYTSILSNLGASDWCLLNNHFDRGLGNIALNAAANFNAVGAPTWGRLYTGPSSLNPWTAGKFKTGLRGTSNTSSANYNYCDTGYNRGLCDSFSVLWWMKQRYSPGTSLSYVWGGMGSFRCFTNGVAGTGLWVRSWGGPDLKLATNIQTLARRSQGVCVGLTVNAVTKRAQWYIDGVAFGSPIVIPNGANVAASSSAFKIGKHSSNTSSSVYDLDEFKLCNWVMSAGTIRTWCTTSQSHSTPYTNACRIWHGSRGGVPRLGNSSYALTINGPPNMRFLLAVGARSTQPFDMGIVFPPLRGCTWWTRFDLQVIGRTGSSGDLIIPARIPSSTSVLGSRIDSQVLGFTGTLNTPHQSNALRHAIERN